MKKLLLFIAVFFYHLIGFGQKVDFYQKERAQWLKIAEQTTPKLVETIKRPLSIVRLEKDEKKFQHWDTKPQTAAENLLKIRLKNKLVWYLILESTSQGLLLSV
jgi:hypothetical protein